MNGPSVRREDYTARELSEADLEVLRAYVAQFHDNERVPLTKDTRMFPARNLRPFKDQEDCPHTTSTMFEVSNKHGVWGVLVCDDCGRQNGRECPHVRCSWHLDGTILVCDNCGIDGT